MIRQQNYTRLDNIKIKMVDKQPEESQLTCHKLISETRNLRNTCRTPSFTFLSTLQAPH